MEGPAIASETPRRFADPFGNGTIPVWGLVCAAVALFLAAARIPLILWLLVVPPMPLVAMLIVARSKGRLKFHSRKRQSSNVEIIVSMVPALVGLRCLGFEWVAWTPLALLAIAIGLAYSTLGYAAARKSRSMGVRGKGVLRIWAGLAVIGTMYGFGLAAGLNGVAESAPVRTYRAKILDKFIEPGRHSYPKLRLESDSSELGTISHRIGRADYANLRPGGELCINLHTGLLGLKWTDLAKCDPVTAVAPVIP